MNPRTVLAVTLLTSAWAGAARAQDGTLDPSFGFGGAVRVAFDQPGSSFRDVPAAVAVQPDGRIVVAGTADGGAMYADTAVARLTRQGALDPTFAAGGRYVASFIYEDAVSALAVLADGSIVVAGSDDTVPSSGASIVLRKLTPSGAVATSAGIPVGGVLADPGVGLAADPAAAKLYVAFSRQAGAQTTIVIQRYFEDFSTDWSYGTGGELEVQHFLGWPLVVAALALDDEGRLVVGATVLGPGGNDFFVARATSAGALDPSFGSGGHGFQTIPIDLVANGDDGLRALALDAQGGIVLAGDAEAPGFGDRAAVLVRLLPSGLLDAGFNGGAPLAVADTAGNDAVNGVAVQGDGKIVVAGKVFGPSPRFFAARYWPDGSADWSFGDFGQFSANFPDSPYDDYAVAVAFAGGMPILVGPAEWSAPDYDFGVMRLRNALIFMDGFERGSAGSWSATVP